ncbi:MAG: hypothetical protein IKI97_13860 [Clostridia bacterium]|nr:hypothetical protein [Clostridia bacterium]
MNSWLDKIRTPNRDIKLSLQVSYSILILLFGVALGVLSKWLDNMWINDAIWWQHILGIIDLRNVFSEFAIWLLIAIALSVYSSTPLRAALNVFLFFVGMCISYHLYTIVFAGFNPQRYMMVWYGFTILSPVLAFICWYGKGETKVSLMIDILILSVMMSECFAIGFLYFAVNRVINVIIFFGSVAILYSKPKQTVISLLGAFVLSNVFTMLI